MPQLVHLNGPPGVGKSTLAHGLVARRPMALDVDIDALRVRLGGWRTDPDSKQVARSLGFTLAATHLAAGHDVVLPQLLLRSDAIGQLEATALAAGAAFLEVVLLAPAAELVGRLPETPSDPRHPRDLFAPHVLAEQIEHARDELRSDAAARPAWRLVDVGGLDEAAALARVADAIGW